MPAGASLIDHYNVRIPSAVGGREGLSPYAEGVEGAADPHLAAVTRADRR